MGLISRVSSRTYRKSFTYNVLCINQTMAPKRRFGFGSKKPSKPYPKQNTYSNTSYNKNSYNKNSYSNPSSSYNKPKVNSKIPYAGLGAYGTTKTFNSLSKGKGTFIGGKSGGMNKYAKGAIALGTAYVGYKVAKGVGKTIGQAYFRDMPRIYGSRSMYYGNSR